MAMIRLILNTIELLAVPSIDFHFFLPLHQPLCEDDCILAGRGCDGWSNVLSIWMFSGRTRLSTLGLQMLMAH